MHYMYLMHKPLLQLLLAVVICFMEALFGGKMNFSEPNHY